VHRGPSGAAWLVLRPLCRDATGLDLAFLALGVALLRRRDDRGIDDLTAHRQKPGRRERRIEAFEQNRDRRVAFNLGSGQRLAEGPDCIGARHRVGETQSEKAHEQQPVLDQVFGALV